jgi:hypothetical protein
VSPLNGGAPGIEGSVTTTGVARMPLSLGAGETSGAGAVEPATISERGDVGAGAPERESSACPEVPTVGRGVA